MENLCKYGYPMDGIIYCKSTVDGDDEECPWAKNNRQNECYDFKKKFTQELNMGEWEYKGNVKPGRLVKVTIYAFLVDIMDHGTTGKSVWLASLELRNGVGLMVPVDQIEEYHP